MELEQERVQPSELQVFISYRRQVDASDARSLYFCLRSALTEEQVFMDLRNLDAGVEFSKEIQSRIEKCNVFLAVIGSLWLGLERNGIRRLDEPDDYVRKEIEWALQLDRLVIPLLMPGTAMPPTASLPLSIQPLTGRQAEAITHDNFERDCRTLIEKMCASLTARRRHQGDEMRKLNERRIQELDLQISSHEIMKDALLSQLGGLSKALADLQGERSALQGKLQTSRRDIPSPKWRNLVSPAQPDPVSPPLPASGPAGSSLCSRLTAPGLPHPMIRIEPGVEQMQVFSVLTSTMVKLTIEMDRAFAVSERLVTNGDWRRVTAGSNAAQAIGDKDDAPRTLISPDEIGTYVDCLNRSSGGGYFWWGEREWLFAAIRLGKSGISDFVRTSPGGELWEWLSEEWGDYARLTMKQEAMAALHSGSYAWCRMDVLWQGAAQNLHSRRPYLTSMRAGDIGFRVARRL